MGKPVARMSALPALRYCGQPQIIGATLGAGRPAAIGTAFHAMCSEPDSQRTQDLLLRLSDREREQVEELIKPTDYQHEYGVTLSYADAMIELPVGLNEKGQYVDYDDPSAILRGTLDMGWVLEVRYAGMHARVAFVADIKKTSWAAPDGSESLQVIGYAIALAAKHQCDGYITGIWDATAGEWDWGDYVDCWSERGDENWRRVLAAVNNHGGEYSIGTHCNGCYSRVKCPQYLMPLELAETSLGALTDIGELSDEKALELLTLAKRVATTAEEVEKILKMRARDRMGIVDHARGKVWMPVKTKGRASLNKKSLEKEAPELVQRHTSFGAEFDTFKWLNIKKGK